MNLDEDPWIELGITKTQWVIDVVHYRDGFLCDLDDDLSDGVSLNENSMALVEAFEQELRHCVEGAPASHVRPRPIEIAFGGEVSDA